MLYAMMLSYDYGCCIAEVVHLHKGTTYKLSTTVFIVTY